MIQYMLSSTKVINWIECQTTGFLYLPFFLHLCETWYEDVWPCLWCWQNQFCPVGDVTAGSSKHTPAGSAQEKQSSLILSFPSYTFFISFPIALNVSYPCISVRANTRHTCSLCLPQFFMPGSCPLSFLSALDSLLQTCGGLAGEWDKDTWSHNAVISQTIHLQISLQINSEIWGWKCSQYFFFPGSSQR